MQPSNLRGVASMASTRVPSPLKAPRRRRDARSFPERHGLNHVPLRIIVGAPPLFFPLLAQVFGVLGQHDAHHGRHGCVFNFTPRPTSCAPLQPLQATYVLLLGCVVAAAPRSMGACSPSDGCPRASRELCCGRCNRQRMRAHSTVSVVRSRADEGWTRTPSRGTFQSKHTTLRPIPRCPR